MCVCRSGGNQFHGQSIWLKLSQVSWKENSEAARVLTTYRMATFGNSATWAFYLQGTIKKFVDTFNYSLIFWMFLNFISFSEIGAFILSSVQI